MFPRKPLSPSNRAFGRALRKVRKQRGWTQEALAFEAGLDRTYVSLLETGSSSPTLDTMLAIAGACDITLVSFAEAIAAELEMTSPNE